MKLKEASLPSLAVLTIIFVLYLFIDFIDATGFAFFIYGVSMIHITWSIVNKRCRSVPVRYSVHLCNLAMLTISCFTLNESVEIFAKFTPWVYVILLLTFITLLLDVFVEIPFKLWKFVYGLMITLGLFVAVYFNILLLPMFLVGIIGIIVLGLGIHLFVPAILAITIIVHLYKKWQHHYLMAGVITGVLIAGGSLFMFFTNINKAHDVLENENVSYVTSEQKHLPRWVYIAQKLPKNKWTEMMLLSDFKYELFDNWFMGRGINTGNSLGEKGLHEPFLNLAKLTGLHKMSLSDADRLMILKTNFNSRHETSRKLWSGEHLVTSQCVTDVKLYPDYRLAYTQKKVLYKKHFE
jgi:XrtN system VIT domain protein